MFIIFFKKLSESYIIIQTFPIIMDKLYLPKDESTVFPILKSESGIVIPLVDFGYPHYHATLFIRELEAGKYLFNVHVKDELSGNNITTKSIDFREEDLKKNFEEKK